jgi:hypothetical protein
MAVAPAPFNVAVTPEASVTVELEVEIGVDGSPFYLIGGIRSGGLGREQRVSRFGAVVGRKLNLLISELGALDKKPIVV